jgi:hypothetical protein
VEPAPAVHDERRRAVAAFEDFEGMGLVYLIQIDPERRQLADILGGAALAHSGAGAEIDPVWFAGPCRDERGDLVGIAGEDRRDPALAAHVRASAQLHEPIGELEQRC